MMWFKFFGLFSFIIILLPQALHAENLDNCRDWQDDRFCEIFDIIENFEKLTNSDDLPLIIKIVNDADDNIGYFATFRLLQTLLQKHENFFQSKDYYDWKRKFIIQLVKYQKETNDSQRPQIYLLYLFQIMEPIENIQTREYGNRVKRHQFSEENIRYINCFIKNDLAYLNPQQIIDSEAFNNCRK